MIDAVLAVEHAIGPNGVLIAMWVGVFVIWMCAAWLSHSRGRAYFTWHKEEGMGQNWIDRTVEGCIVRLAKLATWGAFVLAAWQTLETAGFLPPFSIR